MLMLCWPICYRKGVHVCYKESPVGGSRLGSSTLGAAGYVNKAGPQASDPDNDYTALVYSVPRSNAPVVPDVIGQQRESYMNTDISAQRESYMVIDEVKMTATYQSAQ